MNKIAVIDLGTNTFNIIVGQTDVKGDFNRLDETKIAVKLGEGGINSGIIAPEPFQRGINALHRFKQITNDWGVDQVYLFATSAIRNASNGIEFVKKIESLFNWYVHVISGDTEAQLIYYGVRRALDLGDKPVLIMDIGGGSTEFIIGNNTEVFWKKSFEIGAARLLEKFNPSEPITSSEIKEVFNYLDIQLIELKKAADFYHIDVLVGSSGSFDSYAGVIMDRYYKFKSLDGTTTYDFSMNQFNETYNLFVSSNREERSSIKGLIAMRVDMIVIASLLIRYVVDNFKIKNIRMSKFSLKEGVLWAIQNQLIKK
jgi:exopolyphosphatase/guanosine-5'-triphosphate,3'-diphosphate pyrophosphatase